MYRWDFIPFADVKNYYTDYLSAENLKRCYDIAPPRVRQYLDAEVCYVLQKLHPGAYVLELGCGYGRIFPALSKTAGLVVGIDTSLSSLLLGRQMLTEISNCLLMQMDAVALSFLDETFDLVLCIQNGISAFHVDQKGLIRESIRVAKNGGTILFSSYSEKFWTHRLEWFRLQSEASLLGKIDNERTRDGVIVCEDGFTASTVGPDGFLRLTQGLNVDSKLVEVDESSLFCEIVPHKTNK